jgi:hypothetical protein
MINKEMKDYKPKNDGKQDQLPTRKPDEHSGIYFSSGIKIFDPNSGEVILHKRGDT